MVLSSATLPSHPKRDWTDHMLILLVGWLIDLKQAVTVVAQAVLRLSPSAFSVPRTGTAGGQTCLVVIF